MDNLLALGWFDAFWIIPIVIVAEICAIADYRKTVKKKSNEAGQKKQWT